MTIDDAVQKFCLPDLPHALASYLHSVSAGIQVHSIGGRRVATEHSQLPFDKLEVWKKVRLQSKSYHSNEPLPSQTVNAAPKSDAWPHGQCDAVLINTDRSKQWPRSGLQGELTFVIQKEYLSLSLYG